MDLNSVPQKWQTSIRNNGGGYVNHIIYWVTMCKNPTPPSDALKRIIGRSFGNFEAFKEEFTAHSKKLFGSGYVWLSMSEDLKELSIQTLPNQVQTTLVEQKAALLSSQPHTLAY